MAIGTTASIIAFYKMLMAAGLTTSAAGLIDEYRNSLTKNNKLSMDEANKIIDRGFKSFKESDINKVKWNNIPSEGSVIASELETFLGKPIEEFQKENNDNGSFGSWLGKPIKENGTRTDSSGAILNPKYGENDKEAIGNLTATEDMFDFDQTTTGDNGGKETEENLDEKAQANLPSAPEQGNEEGIKDETNTNLEFNMTEYINWAEQQQQKEWAREDQLRQEDWARQDSAYTRMVEDLRKSGANPNLMIGAGASPVSQNSVQSGSSQLNTAVLTEELGNQMELLKQTFENNFKGSEAEKDRFIDIWNTILQTIGFMVAIKGKK